jgi:hypothetical protein
MQSVSSRTEESTHIMIRSSNKELITWDDKRLWHVAPLFLYRKEKYKCKGTGVTPPLVLFRLIWLGLSRYSDELRAGQRSSILGRGKGGFLTPQLSGRLSGSINPLLDGSWRLFSLSSRSLKLTTNLYLELRSRMVKLFHHYPIRLQGVLFG